MVEDGQCAVVHLVITLADTDTIVETTDVDVAMAAGTYEPHRDYRPHEFVVGEGEVAGAVEDAVREIEPGQTRTVTVDPEAAFGTWREEAVIEVDRERLEARSDTDAELGKFVLSARGDAGWITAVGEELVSVDFNHELAGERLTFEVRLLEVRDGPPDVADVRGENETGGWSESETGGESESDDTGANATDEETREE
jgi:FKBP-type peptidyl-prolyl cis-trans isomerase SlyD